MLDLATGWTHDCERVARRSFLQIGSLAMGLSLPQMLGLRSAVAANGVGAEALPSDMNCIFIWTHGGTSHHDTLDPKPTAPQAVKGPFSAINTAVPGVQFSEICPKLSAELGRFAVLRGWNPQNAGHGMAEAWCMSGRNFNPGMRYPCVGSVVSHQQGFRSALPPFVQLHQHLDRTFNGGTAGVLGLEHSPFEIVADPNATKFSVRDISPAQGMAMQRIDRRRAMLAKVDALQRKADLQPAAFDALDEHYKAALNMITAPETKRAFDLDSEETGLRDRYGRTTFGQSLLLARRLIESGVRFVTVTDPGWDNHTDCFNALQKHRMPPIDTALPELIIDLADRGMLEKTLVVWMTDFGRTPKINPAIGRDHWATAGFVVMAGAGIPGGSVLGATDEQGERPIRNEYKTDEVMATIYKKLGLPLDLVVYAPDGRPVRLIEADPIREWT